MTSTPIRLCVYIATNFGISRRKAGELIKNGSVQVDGALETRPWLSLTPDLLPSVTVNDKVVSPFSPDKVYFVVNKPKGYLCTNDSKGSPSPTVFSLLPSFDGKLFSVGRLDKNTSGLLIITNDGHLGNMVAHPRHMVEKEYIAECTTKVYGSHIQKIRQGVYIDNEKILPSKVERLNKFCVSIVVKEGKKHEVRLMLKKVGLRPRVLQRTRIGNLSLGKLKEGHYKYYSYQELAKKLFGSIV